MLDLNVEWQLGNMTKKEMSELKIEDMKIHQPNNLTFHRVTSKKCIYSKTILTLIAPKPHVLFVYRRHANGHGIL
jgi:hypothetical protein